MERDRKPPAPDDEQEKYPKRNTEDDRERKPNTRTREEIRETTIPRKDD
jgi:hypothetical protein